MKKIILFVVVCPFLIYNLHLQAQNIGINATGAAPAASAGLDVNFTNKGLLVPRVALTATNAAGPIAAPATSLLVYNTATAGVTPNNVTPGYYYWNGTRWVAVGGSGGLDWSILGNAGTVSGTNFLGTTDAQALDFRTGNILRLRLANGYQLQANGNGSATAPFYSWSTDPDIGMYRVTTNTLGFASSGLERLRLTTTSSVFNELSYDYDFRIESNNQANIFSINGGTDQIGFFIANSPFGVIKMEANFNDGAFPWVRFINTNTGGTSFIGVGQNDASGGTWAIGAGMGGTADSGPGVSGYANTSTVQAFGGYFENDGAFANVGGWQSGPWVMRKIVGNGTVNTIIDGLTPNEKVTMTCPEAPEVVFQDYGVGELKNGYAKINLDPIFSKNILVDKDHPIKVYIQLEGECNGVYVFNKSDLSFEVKELNNGNSNISFSWMVVANRADVEVKYSDGTSKISNYSNARFSPAPKYTPPASLNDNKRIMIEYNSIKP